MTRPLTTSPAAANVGLGDWFALLGGGVAWTAHLLLCYAVAEFGCVAGLGQVSFLGVTAVAWTLIGVSAVTLSAALAAAVVARRRYAGGQPEPRGAHAAHYMNRLGFVTSALFALIIAAQSLPIVYYLGRC